MRRVFTLGLFAFTQVLSGTAWALPVQSNVAVTDFAYQLTDLDATDGHVASVTFLPTTQSNLFANAGDGYGQAQWSSDSTGTSTLFAGAPNSLQLWGGLISVNKLGNSQQAASALNSNMVNLLGSGDPQSLSANGCCVIGQIKSHDDFQLPARTSMTITGTFLGNADVFADEVGTPAYALAHPDEAMTLRAKARYSFYVVDDTGKFYGDTVPTLLATAEQVFTANGVGPADQAHATLYRPFAFTITNDTDQDQAFHYGSILVSEVEFLTSPIPEPATWALMGLGLLGVAGAAKRRRQAA